MLIREYAARKFKELIISVPPSLPLNILNFDAEEVNAFMTL